MYKYQRFCNYYCKSFADCNNNSGRCHNFLPGGFCFFDCVIGIFLFMVERSDYTGNYRFNIG